MPSKSPDSMCHHHPAKGLPTPIAVRITRPLRDLLAAGDDGLRNTCRHAWEIAAASPGAWINVDPVRLLGDGRHPRVHRIELRARDEDNLDLTMHFADDWGAIAIGRRVIVVAPMLPETLLLTAQGKPLATIIEAPFLAGPAIVVQRSISRLGERQVDIRCRCPSHVIQMGPED